MARAIKLTQEMINEVVEEVKSQALSSVIDGGKINVTKTIDKIERHATLRITEVAYIKMHSLVNGMSKEVGWHGIAKRGENQDEYVIEDIMVYPQVVTSATVDTDQKEYQDWLYDFDDDVFNNIRFQGHSHVNMGVSPSRTDIDFYEELINMMPEDGFYIFGIFNKKWECEMIIYDLLNNVCFETKDINIVVGEINQWLAESKEMVDDYVPKLTSTSTTKSFKKKNKKHKTNKEKEIENDISEDWYGRKRHYNSYGIDDWYYDYGHNDYEIYDDEWSDADEEIFEKFKTHRW